MRHFNHFRTSNFVLLLLTAACSGRVIALSSAEGGLSGLTGGGGDGGAANVDAAADIGSTGTTGAATGGGAGTGGTTDVGSGSTVGSSVGGTGGVQTDAMGGGGGEPPPPEQPPVGDAGPD